MKLNRMPRLAFALPTLIALLGLFACGGSGSTNGPMGPDSADVRIS